jgi:hypothetical protein
VKLTLHVWCTDGLQAIKKVLKVVLGKESSRLKFDDHLLLSSDCSQAEESEIELSFQSPTGYILQESEAAALAYCWNAKVFTADCEHVIFQALYRSRHPAVDVAHATNIESEEQLLCAVESSGWRPGCVMQPAVKTCFPTQPSGDECLLMCPVLERFTCVYHAVSLCVGVLVHVAAYIQSPSHLKSTSTSVGMSTAARELMYSLGVCAGRPAEGFRRLVRAPADSQEPGQAPGTAAEHALLGCHSHAVHIDVYVML